MNDKYTSVDIIFHFNVDADTPTEARRQADEKFRYGAVGCTICNTDKQMNCLEDSIPEEVLNNLRQPNPIIQELAEVTHTVIFDNNSLERAIGEIIPSKIDSRLKKVRELYDKSEDFEFRNGIEAVLDALDIFEW